MRRNNYLFESFILGSLIYWGLTTVDVNVTVNVTDKPIITSNEKVETLQNIERTNTK